MRFEGVHVATTTPFDERGAVDLEALKKHLELLAKAGVHGFVPCGTTGEGSVLSASERQLILKMAREVASRYSLKVIAGCGSNDTRQVIDLMNEAKALGADAALVVTPYYNKPTAAGLIAHYETAAREGGLPIVLYNVPSRTNVNLTPEIVKTLFENPQIVGLKEASGNFGQWMALAHGLNLEKKALLAGDDDAFSTLLLLGGCGIISASANVFPKPFVEIFNLSKNGKWAEAAALQKRLYPFLKAMFIETNPAPVKYAIERLGGERAHLRLPLVGVTDTSKGLIDRSLSQWSRS